MNERDHRAIGQRLDLFHFEEEAPGMVFWHPRGLSLYRVVEEHLRRRVSALGFEEVRTPIAIGDSLWRQSGHAEHFAGGMFSCVGGGAREEDEAGGRRLSLKPVSCPAHIRLVERRAPSYRDLPLRLAEFGCIHRNEPSGSVQGLLRLRQFTQDDGHVFCAEAHVVAEVAAFCRSLHATYADFGFSDVVVAFADRPKERAGADELWDRAEAALRAAAARAGLAPVHHPGEGAFYGPKLEFALRDAHGRLWQCGTIQLDLVLPERFDLRYVDAAGARVRPVMLHRAVLGSLERFLALLLEHYGGALPAWLAPEQARVATVAERHSPYAQEVVRALDAAGLRAALDARPETLGRKAQEARADGVPALLVVGDREAAAGEVSVRLRGAAPLGQPLAEAVAALAMAAQPPAIAAS